MTLIKLNNRNRLFPFGDSRLNDLWNSNDFFNDNFFFKEREIPAMNIKELDNEFEIEFAAPGFSKKDFKITINQNVLNISGKNEHEKEAKEDEYTRKEFSYNSFQRSLILPENVDIDSEVKASYTNGILKLHILKKEVTKNTSEKTIEVN